jgi:hypothetical protein
VGTAERPLTAHRGWRVVDRVDVADLDDERAHRWVAGGTQATLLHRETGAAGLLLDGGRTLAGDAQFRITVDPAKPMRLVLRTGGARAQETLTAASLVVNGHALAVPAPRGTLVEVEVEIPASSTISVEADRSYRAFHWFVLQPD